MLYAVLGRTHAGGGNGRTHIGIYTHLPRKTHSPLFRDAGEMPSEMHGTPMDIGKRKVRETWRSG